MPHLNLWKRLRNVSSMVEKSLYTFGLLSKNGLCLPNFLGIGAQKAGTTWLYENLRHHPDLYLPEPKELHYFDWEFHKPLKSYSNKFRPGCHKVKGEITPGYSIIPLERIQFIQNIMPDVKLIFLMRNPIRRAYSQALMNLVKLRNRNIEDVHESEFYAHFKAARSVKRGDYQAILNNWLSVFPRDQLYVAFFEDIVNRPRELLGEVFDHIGVSRDVEWSCFPYIKVVHKGLSIPLPKQYRAFLEDMYRRDIDMLHERFGAAVAGWRCS